MAKQKQPVTDSTEDITSPTGDETPDVINTPDADASGTDSAPAAEPNAPAGTNQPATTLHADIERQLYAPRICAVCGSVNTAPFGLNRDDLADEVRAAIASYYKCKDCNTLTGANVGATAPGESTDAEFLRYQKEAAGRIGTSGVFELYPLTAKRRAEQQAARDKAAEAGATFTEPKLDVLALNRYAGFAPDFRQVALRAGERVKVGGWVVLIQQLYGDQNPETFANRYDVRADNGQSVIPSREGLARAMEAAGFVEKRLSVKNYITFYHKVK